MNETLVKIEKEIQKRNISPDKISEVLTNNKDIMNRRVIGGYSSVNVIDREGQQIPVYALKEAVNRFMQNIFMRNCMIFHSDIQIGRVLPYWTNPDTGEIVKTRVDNKGWYTVCELRDDIDVANRTWDEVVKGNIRSFSIAGNSKDKLQKQNNGVSFEQIKSLDIAETTLCETPVNQLATFTILHNPISITI